MDMVDIGLTVDNTKRFMGRYLDDPVVHKLWDSLNYQLIEDNEHRPFIKIRIEDQIRKLYAEDIEAYILKQV